MSSNPYEPPRANSVRRRKPIKIKVYGLFPMTRTGYLTTQVVMAVAFVVVLLAIRSFFEPPRHPLHFCYTHTWLVIGIALALEGVETVVMLGKYRAAERKRASE